MKCPVCNVPLIMTDRQGVEIDYCPQCRGVWLDRGELDKIIERVSLEQRPMDQRPMEQRPMEQRPPYQRRDDDDDDRRYESDRRYSGDRDDDYRQKSRRKSFLGELFDFD